MADTPAISASPSPASRPSAAKGSFFTKKELGLPIWAWIAILGGGAVAYILWARSQSSSATVPSAPASSGSGSGPGGGSGPTPSSVPPQPVPLQPVSPGNPALPFQVQSGSGWWAGGSNWAKDTPQQQAAAAAKAQAAGPITGADGNSYEWLDSQEYQAIKNSGVQIYFEVLPGVFVPVPTGLAGLAPGTPLYMQVPAGTQANPASGGTSGGLPEPVSTSGTVSSSGTSSPSATVTSTGKVSTSPSTSLSAAQKLNAAWLAWKKNHPNGTNQEFAQDLRAAAAAKAA